MNQTNFSPFTDRGKSALLDLPWMFPSNFILLKKTLTLCNASGKVWKAKSAIPIVGIETRNTVLGTYFIWIKFISHMHIHPIRSGFVHNFIECIRAYSFYISWKYVSKDTPVNTQRRNNVVTRSLRRHDITATSKRRYYDVVCLLGQEMPQIRSTAFQRHRMKEKWEANK